MTRGRIIANEDSFCQGDSNGLISIEPQDLNIYPVFNIAVVSGEMSYTYKGAPGTDLKECLAMICMNGNDNQGQNKYQQSFVMKNSFDDEFKFLYLLNCSNILISLFFPNFLSFPPTMRD